MKRILFFLTAALLVSCSDMLDTAGDNMVKDPALDSKNDSVFSAFGVAQAMQQLADQYFFIGEMRGDLVTTTNSTDNNLRQLHDFSADVTNAYDSAYVYYKVINNCNYYLEHRDTTLYTGAINVTTEEYAAMAAYRAWAYLQLARTYCGNEAKVPFYTKPLTSISEVNEDNCEKKNLHEIVAALAPELEKFSGVKIPMYAGDLSNNWTMLLNIGETNWGGNKQIILSQIFVPVDVVLGEMYLEDGQWEKAAQHYCKFLCADAYGASNYQSFRHSKNFVTYEQLPEAFSINYNTTNLDYTNMFSNVSLETVSLIPMSVSKQRGTTSNVPLAFGYDYYSTDQSSSCPRVDAVQIKPSQAYYALTDSADYYYYPKAYQSNGAEMSYPVSVASAKFGDGRASYGVTRGNSNQMILNRNEADTTLTYISKNVNSNIIVYRLSTVYLHLAEAFNRMGYPDASFAVLRNGISTYLEDIVNIPDTIRTEGSDEYTLVYPEYKYMSQEAIDMLSETVPFLSAANREYFPPTKMYGIHNHGAGTSLTQRGGSYIEDGVSVVGSRATAVGSQKNLMYLPKPIIGAKLEEMNKKYNLNLNSAAMTKTDSIAAMADILCDEYAKEFAFEGCRFYDLQRMARHYNESGVWGGNFGSIWFSEKLKNNNPQKNLTDPKNWYLPFR